MKITIKNIEREVRVYRRKDLILCFVGRARVYWKPYYKEPYIIIPKQNREVVAKYTPLILEFIKEYKRLVSIKKKTPPLSFEGEGQTDSIYKYKLKETQKDYVSGVPKWLRDVKIQQVCSGPIRTFTRGIRIPQIYKELAKSYSSYCCNCAHRVSCTEPCLLPEVTSQEELIVGL